MFCVDPEKRLRNKPTLTNGGVDTVENAHPKHENENKKRMKKYG